METKQQQQQQQLQQLQQQQQRTRWLFPLLASLLLSSLLVSASLFSTPSPSAARSFAYDILEPDYPLFVEDKLRLLSPPPSANPVPRIAYLISGSAGDGESLRRTLRAIYHPWNAYAVHLDLEASAAERMELAAAVRADPVYARFGNVHVVVKANLVTYRGPTMVANTLHAAAILLEKGGEWDWFINLSASDYPLVTQDGSAWMMLTRQFVEFCLWGWDNLPRTVLMYYANFLSSPEGYFHTVICNVDEFRNTTVNHDLHFISWDNPPKQHPHFLNLGDFPRMVSSNAPFARKFSGDEPVLDKIDGELLGRRPGGFAPGGWWSEGASGNTSDLQFHPLVGASGLRPGAGADRLKQLMDGLLSAEDFDRKHCI